MVTFVWEATMKFVTFELHFNTQLLSVNNYLNVVLKTTGYKTDNLSYQFCILIRL
jgi:hypothetical protein